MACWFPSRAASCRIKAVYYCLNSAFQRRFCRQKVLVSEIANKIMIL
jgi:hypothetical protein